MISSGVLVPLVTPIDEHGVVSERDVASMLDFLRDHVDCLVPALSTGEGWLLDDRQWDDMVASTVRQAGSLPVYAGALSATTAGVIQRARRAAELGAAAVVATTPYGMGVTQQEMFQHFAQIQEASPIPLVVYDEVEQSGNVTQLSTLRRISELPGVVAIKDSHGDRERWEALRAAALDAKLWLGREELVGVVDVTDGVLLAVANLAPELCGRWWQSRDAALAEEIQDVCRAHSLFDPDWYVNIKRALRAASHLGHDRPVPEVSPL